MPVKIRLRRMGAKKQPSYRVVVAESQSPRGGAFIETIGHYNPLTKPATINVNEDRVVYWVERGAQPTEAVVRLFKKINLTEKVPQLQAYERTFAAPAASASEKPEGKPAVVASEKPEVKPAEVASEKPEVKPAAKRAAKVKAAPEAKLEATAEAEPEAELEATVKEEPKEEPEESEE